MSTVQARISAFESLTTHADPIDFLESPPPAMVTASLQPVIAATRPSPSPSPPGLGRKTSLIDLKDWVVDDGFFPPPRRSSNNRLAFSQLKPANATKGQSQEHPSSPAAATGNIPLIDLHSPQKSKPKPKAKPANLTSAPTQTRTAASTKQRPPQLPPRKESAAPSSPRQLNFLYPPRRQDSSTADQRLEPHSRGSSHAPSSSISSFHSVSLSSDTDTSRPGSISNFIATFPMERERSSSSATSGANDIDSVSLTESFEEVSASALTSPVTEEKIEWQYATRKPPKLPERPPSTNSTTKTPSQPRRATMKAAAGSGPSSPVIQPSLSRHSSVSTLSNAAPPYSPYTPRRTAPPPPPPSRSSDRSSILSNATTQSFSSHSSQSYQQPSPLLGAPVVALKIKRPTPVPLAARQRYEVVFIKNVLQQRKAKANEKEKLSTGLLNPHSPSEVARTRRAAGWRGLSVDLIVDPEGPTTNGAQTLQRQRVVDETVDNDDKIEGSIVRLVWKKSGLDSTRLAEIWNECDPAGQGALNLDGFVKGMWRIDEELRRTQAHTLKSTGTNNLGLYRHQSARSPSALVSIPVAAAPPRLPPRYKDILR